MSDSNILELWNEIKTLVESLDLDVVKNASAATGAAVLSTIYASFSLEILSLSKIGLKIVPTVSAEMLDSTKIKIPVIAAYNWILFLLLLISLEFELKLFLTFFINPATPPEIWIKVIREPTRKVNNTTRVFPGSKKTSTIPFIVRIKPFKGFQSPIISHPKNIPVKREINTCLVLIAKVIAIIGGIKDRKP